MLYGSTGGSWGEEHPGPLGVGGLPDPGSPVTGLAHTTHHTNPILNMPHHPPQRQCNSYTALDYFCKDPVFKKGSH